jgi:prepilin-type N-terminal cleavage/methylation domain-containing protein
MSNPSSHPGSGAQKGFTFLEMLVVLVIVGVMAGMAAITWNRTMGKYKARSAMDELRNAILQSRSDAMTRKRYSGILIDVGNLQYMRFVDDQPSSPNPQNGVYDDGETVLQPWKALPAQMVFLGPPSSSRASVRPPRGCGIVPPVATSAAGTYSVVFRPDGGASASFDALVGIANLPADTFRLTVTPPTGFVGLVRR